jgi:uncharacterized protein (DUF58 family)
LQQLEAAGETDLAGATQRFVAQTARRGMAIVISDFYDADGCKRAIDTLRHARFETVLLRVVDRAELEPQLSGALVLRDAETGALRNVDVTPLLLARYREARASADERLRRYCAEHQVSLFTLETSREPERALLHVLRRAGIFG